MHAISKREIIPSRMFTKAMPVLTFPVTMINGRIGSDQYVLLRPRLGITQRNFYVYRHWLVPTGFYRDTTIKYERDTTRIGPDG
jgi:hypothetical protein